MNGHTRGRLRAVVARLLAVLSVGGFWVLPFAPLVAIGAVSLTRDVAGWPRRAATAGAWLCVGYTVVLAVVVLRLALQVSW